MKRKAAIEKTVLIITYVFPPTVVVGAHRSLKYCKYLGRYGWKPIVLTATPASANVSDESLLSQLPTDVSIHRTWDLDPERWEAKLAERKSRRSRPATTGSSSGEGPTRGSATAGRTGLANRLKGFVKTLFKDTPDPHVLWVPFAFWKGVRLLLRERVDLIYCSSPPHSSHIAAFLLAKCFRKPYVLDFRDPWYVNGSVRKPSPRFSLGLKLETAIKRIIVENAARVISVSRGECHEIRQEFPELSERSFTFITNGYDPTDIPSDSTGKASSGKLTLIHAGTIYDGIAGEFFEALTRLMRDHPGVETKVQIQFVGRIALEYWDAVRALETTGIAKNYDQQTHDTTLRMILESDVPVILLGGSRFLPSHIPAKVFEYLCVGKPILTIARDGELVDIVSQSGLGIVVSPDSIAGVARALWRLCEDHASGQLTRVPNPSYIRSFERAALAEKLASVLDEVRGADPT
jgi:glycosyltransferase involved in cell wall biosynthesis